jgi:putative spermidine/putrescine transport system ATP-binding protein
MIWKEGSSLTFVELKDIRVSYDNKNNILKDLSISIEKGELVSLLGPSGCGKTTTLRVIAGLINPQDGQFLLDEQDITKVPVHKRNFGMVFQSYALFPHLTVAENVAFGLKLKKEPKATIEKKVNDMLAVCGLENFDARYPKQLSGGQRQRVALARGLVINPKLLLLDEPLSNLDAKLRITMRMEIKRIQQQLGITTVFVTHDQEECFSISDKVAIMNNGVIEQFDKPETIYAYPKNQFVAKFIGFENFFTVHQMEPGTYQTEDGTIVHSTTGAKTSAEAVATIRPDDIEIVSEKQTEAVKGTVELRTFLGKAYQYKVATKIGEFLVNGDSGTIYNTGDVISLAFPASKLIILEK